MLNTITVQGRLTRDPEQRTTAGGTPVTAFSIACDRDFVDKDSQKATDFLDIVAWRDLAKFVAAHFSKSDMILVKGRLQIREWTDREGNKRRNAEIVAESLYFCGTNISDNEK